MGRIMIGSRFTVLADVKADGALSTSEPDPLYGSNVDVADGLEGRFQILASRSKSSYKDNSQKCAERISGRQLGPEDLKERQI
jgi:hypothetical protein